MQLLRRATTRAYRELIYHRRREAPFWMLASFLPTFLAARATVYIFPAIFFNVRGTHIHHFIYGIILLAIVGYIAIVYPDRPRRLLAFIYGIGLALATDEFGMWLHLSDDYYLRRSYDAVLVITAFLISVVYFSDFWSRVGRYLFRRNGQKTPTQ